MSQTPSTPDTPRIATPSGSAHARLLSVGSYRPARVVYNDELVEAHRLLRPVDPGAAPASSAAAGRRPTGP